MNNAGDILPVPLDEKQKPHLIKQKQLPSGILRDLGGIMKQRLNAANVAKAEQPEQPEQKEDEEGREEEEEEKLVEESLEEVDSQVGQKIGISVSDPLSSTKHSAPPPNARVAPPPPNTRAPPPKVVGPPPVPKAATPPKVAARSERSLGIGHGSSHVENRGELNDNNQ